MRIYFPKTKSKQEYTWASNNAQYLKSIVSRKTWGMETWDYSHLQGPRPNSSQLQVLYTEDAQWSQNIFWKTVTRGEVEKGFKFNSQPNPVLPYCLSRNSLQAWTAQAGILGEGSCFDVESPQQGLSRCRLRTSKTSEIAQKGSSSAGHQNPG